MIVKTKKKKRLNTNNIKPVSFHLNLNLPKETLINEFLPSKNKEIKLTHVKTHPTVLINGKQEHQNIVRNIEKVKGSVNYPKLKREYTHKVIRLKKRNRKEEEGKARRKLHLQFRPKSYLISKQKIMKKGSFSTQNSLEDEK